MENIYDHFESEKVRIISKVPDTTKKRIEKSITKQVKENMKKNKSNFLNVGDLLDIKDISKYFEVILINGPRAIGKSYSVKQFLMKRYREHKERFVWVRNTETQSLKNLKNDGLFWKEFGYEIFPGNGAVVSLNDDNKSVNNKNVKDITGWYLGLKTSKNNKSIDYKGTRWIHFEEYSDGTKIEDKFDKFTSLVSTVFRLRTDGVVIMSANMISQSEPFLARLGMDQKKGVSKLLTFNWLVGAIIWNIPKDYYKKNTGKDLLAYKLSLAGGVELYKQEYGGQFTSEYSHNIKKITNFKNVIDKYIIRYDNLKWIVCYDKQTKEHYIVDWERRRNDSVREYVINKKDYNKYKQSKMIPYKTLKFLNVLWKREEIFTDEIKIAEKMIEFLDHSVDRKELISEVKSI